MLIDFHTHCFPEKIAKNALNKLSFAAGGLEPYTLGTVDSLCENMKKSSIDKSVVLGIATNEKQQSSVNDFAASIDKKDEIIAFGSVYPFSKDALEELERIKALGLKGVKLHPDYQGFDVDDIKMKPIYEKISRLGLITVFHAGIDYGFSPPYGATPEKLERALSWFSSPVVAAHWGGLGMSEGVIERLCSKDIYFDTAFGYSTMAKCYAQRILEKHGVDKILFGTDSPWHTKEMEIKLLDSLDLSQTEREKIFSLNAQKLLKTI